MKNRVLRGFSFCKNFFVIEEKGGCPAGRRGAVFAFAEKACPRVREGGEEGGRKIGLNCTPKGLSAPPLRARDYNYFID